MRYSYRITDGVKVIRYDTTNTMTKLSGLKKYCDRRGYKFEAWELEFKEIEV